MNYCSQWFMNVQKRDKNPVPGYTEWRSRSPDTVPLQHSVQAWGQQAALPRASSYTLSRGFAGRLSEFPENQWVPETAWGQATENRAQCIGDGREVAP